GEATPADPAAIDLKAIKIKFPLPMDIPTEVGLDLIAAVEALRRHVAELEDGKYAPVQGYSAGIPWSMHLRAYDMYCKKYSPQPALVDLEKRNCRGGFGTEELDEFIPGWRDELSKTVQLLRRVEAAEARVVELEDKLVVERAMVAMHKAAEDRAVHFSEAAEARVVELAGALERAKEAMDTWVCMFAPELCDAAHVEQAKARIRGVGTLAYIAEINKKVIDAMIATPAEALERARGEDYAAGLEAAAIVADQHRGSAAKARLAKDQPLGRIDDDGLVVEIRAEERGEDIAAEIIAKLDALGKEEG
ncbi:hypothetical protein LCGC14_2172440, partial [marine sediment metagenome]